MTLICSWIWHCFYPPRRYHFDKYQLLLLVQSLIPQTRFAKITARTRPMRDQTLKVWGLSELMQVGGLMLIQSMSGYIFKWHNSRCERIDAHEPCKMPKPSAKSDIGRSLWILEVSLSDTERTFRCFFHRSTRSLRPGRNGHRWACGGRCCTGGTAPPPHTDPLRRPLTPPSHSPGRRTLWGDDGSRVAASPRIESCRSKRLGSSRPVGVLLRTPWS